MTPPFASLKIGWPDDAAIRFAQDRLGGFCFAPAAGTRFNLHF
jgi:hypothetical protein